MTENIRERIASPLLSPWRTTNSVCDGESSLATKNREDSLFMFQERVYVCTQTCVYSVPLREFRKGNATSDIHHHRFRLVTMYANEENCRKREQNTAEGMTRRKMFEFIVRIKVQMRLLMEHGLRERRIDPI